MRSVCDSQNRLAVIEELAVLATYRHYIEDMYGGEADIFFFKKTVLSNQLELGKIAIVMMFEP